MGGRTLRLAAACAAALTLAAPAWGHTDTVRQLALEWPAWGSVSRGFGYDHGAFHPGIDIAQLRSTEVRAAASGIVERVGYTPGFEGYGEIVLVSLGHGMEALYAHLARVGVRPGEAVGAGERLGVAGCTGICTGTHLHFELRQEGTPIDPAPLLPSVGPTR